MAPGPKTPQEHEEDKVRLKQLALLWWAQKIYEGAHKRCLHMGAYRYHDGTAGSNQYNVEYKKVLNDLRDLAMKLNGLTDKELWAQVKPGPPPPQPHTLSSSVDCASDADCAEYFMCVDGACEPILPPLNLT